MKTLFGGIAVILLIPTLASAAWWNPFSWGQKAQTIETVPISEPVSVPTQEPIIEQVIVEKIVEKPVESVVYRDRIVEKVVVATSSKEMDDLLVKYNRLKAQYDDAVDDLKACRVEPVLSAACQTIKNDIDVKNEEVEKLKQAEEKKVTWYEENSADAQVMTEKINAIKASSKLLADPVILSIETLQKRFNTICK